MIRGMIKTCVRPAAICVFLTTLAFSSPASPQSAQADEPAANPGRPTVSNPATLAPAGYLQFENGVLGAATSPEFSTRYGFNEVIANGPAEVFLGAQVVLIPGEGASPTLAVSYSHRAYDGGAPELDVGSPRNSTIFYASADVKGFHYDANAVFNEVIDEVPDVHRLQFGQTVSISHPLGKGFAVSGESWRFTQPFMHGNAMGNLWAVSYTARKNLVFDAGFNRGLTSSSTHWEAFAGFTYLLPKKLWGR